MADYPPLIQLDTEEKTKLVNYLREIVLNHSAERQNFNDDLIQWQKEYWAKPAQEKKTFPFKGASSLIIPLSAITFEAVHARTMTTAFGIDQKVSSKVINPAFSDFATPIEDFMEYEVKHSRYKERIENSIIELEKFGTGVSKTRYETVTKQGVFYEAGVEQEVPVTVRRGAVVDSVPLSKFYFPFDVASQDDAAWLGEEYTKTLSEIQVLEESGLFYPGVYAALKMLYGVNFNKFEESQQRLENKVPFQPETITFQELWCCFDVKGNGRKEIVVHFADIGNLIMSCRYNWKSDLSKPYRVGRYFPVEHRITGLGICKQNDAFQREITTLHRQRLDNGTIANMRMFVVSRMSGIQPGEPIYPGKTWFVDDPSHIQSLQFGDINSSAFNNEHMTLMYAQQRNGVNEVVLGMPQVGTPGTATSDLARIQEGSKKFDYCFSNIKSFIDDTLVDFMCVIQQFGPRTVQYYTNAENGVLVEQYLTLPEELIRNGLILEIYSAGQNHNKLLDRQNWQSIAAMIQQYYSSIIGLATQMGNPQLTQMIVMKAFVAATEAAKQMLNTYDVKNIDRIIMSEFLNSVGSRAAGLLPATTGPTGQPNAPISNANGGQGTQINNQAGGMASANSPNPAY